MYEHEERHASGAGAESPKSNIQLWYRGDERFDEKYSDGITKPRSRLRKTKSQVAGIAQRDSQLTVDAAGLSAEDQAMDQLVGPEQLSRRHSEYEPRSHNHIEMVPNQQHKLFMSGAFSKPLAAEDAPYFQRAEAQTMPTKTHGHEMAEVLESA